MLFTVRSVAILLTIFASASILASNSGESYYDDIIFSVPVDLSSKQIERPSRLICKALNLNKAACKKNTYVVARASMKDGSDYLIIASLVAIHRDDAEESISGWELDGGQLIRQDKSERISILGGPAFEIEKAFPHLNTLIVRRLYSDAISKLARYAGHAVLKQHLSKYSACPTYELRQAILENNLTIDTYACR